MIKKIIDFSLRDRFMILMATLIIGVAGFMTYKSTPLDAIPDLSDVQVIIFTPYAGQSPQVVEDQVTYPLTTAMLAVPKSKVVRGYSFFGFSFNNLDLLLIPTGLKYLNEQILNFLLYLQIFSKIFAKFLSSVLLSNTPLK